VKFVGEMVIGGVSVRRVAPVRERYTELRADEEYKVRWLGRRGETYRDSKAAGDVGIWTAPAADMVTRYEVPQENGNRTDTRWAEVTDDAGRGMRVWMAKREPPPAEGEAGLWDFALQAHDAFQLQEAGHPYELLKRTRALLRTDAGHHGLGSASCGPAATR